MKRGPTTGAAKEVFAVKGVIEIWGGGDRTRVPDWVLALAEACDAQSLRKVADTLGYSASVISRVLNGKYDGDLGRIAEKAKGALLGQTVMCPVVSEITRDRCLDNQKHGPPFTSSMRARLYRACRGGCPHYRGSR